MNSKKIITVITVILVMILLIAGISLGWNLLFKRDLMSRSEKIFPSQKEKLMQSEKIIQWLIDKNVDSLELHPEIISKTHPNLTVKIQQYIKSEKSKVASTSASSKHFPITSESNTIEDPTNLSVSIIENTSKETQEESEATEKKENTPSIELHTNRLQFKNNQSKVYYTGDIVRGKANGEGRGVFSNGMVYEGDWVNNLKEGKGKETWPDGSSYNGDFNDNSRSGSGTYVNKNNEKYVGEWENDLRNGKGILYDKKGKIKLKGEWKNDIFIQ